jgi:glycosyltransferase involved in cell wall biosynthesis
VNGFAYYYYWFNKQRVLEEPLDMLLASDVEMPFLIIWANENWTRTWDGSESEVLLRQDYREEDEQELLSDLARHFKDPRYIKVDGRPLFIIYNPAAVPDPLVTIARWRKSLQDSHDVDPLIFMAQTFGRRDPRPYGLDGAIEFPPHKLSDTLPGRATPDAYSSDFQGRVIDYDDFCRVSLSEEEPEFPLIKTVVPSWDNECRRPNRGLSLEDSSPEKYQRWLQILIERSIERPVIDTPIVAINAWNEWAEGAYLEPDVYFGAAYLNATARAYVTAVNRLSSSPAPTRTTVAGEKRVSVILPNFNHERFLEERIGSVVSQSTPPDEIIFLDDCSSDGSVALAEALLSKSGIPYQIVVNSVNSGGVFRQWMKGLELAKNDLVWIAETDDAAHPDFLTETLPYFERDDISAVFGRIQCVDDQGNSLPDLETYFDNLVDFSWHVSCVVPAYRAFRRDFAIRNVVPNASGLVFRKPHLSAQEQQRLFEYRFAGDWYFYALVLRGGALAYSRKARSFFRLSRSGTSRSSFFSDQHLLEHKMVLEDLDCQFRLPKEAVEEHIKALQPLFPNKSESTLLSYLTPEPTSAGPVRPLRICIAAHSFAVGGGEILPVELANELKGSGHHITFLVIEKIDIETTRTIRERLRADIPVVYWDDIKGNFNGFLADFGIEILNSHNVSVEFNLFVHGMRPKVRYVASLHGGYETVPHLMTSEFASYLTETVDRWLYLSEKNTTLLKQNGVSADTFGRIFNAVPTLLSGSIDRAAFRKTHSIPSDATVLFMCSRAIEEKGWRAAIEVTQALRAARGPNIYLVLIGEGPSAEELKSVYDSAGWVIFLGHIDNPARYFSCFDIGIFPSTFSGETFPLFIVECFQAGVPVVATDIGEIPYMLAEGPSGRPGVLVAHNQGRLHLVYEMIKCLQELLDDQPRLGQLRTAAADASKRFSMERLGDEYSRLFTNLTCAE